jgi:hypothetical protein
MANVFSIEFNYRGGTYTGLASVRSHGEDRSVFVQVFDRNLHHLAPEGELHFQLTSNLRRAAEPVHVGKRELVRSVREAVIQKINWSPAPPVH